MADGTVTRTDPFRGSGLALRDGARRRA